MIDLILNVEVPTIETEPNNPMHDSHIHSNSKEVNEYVYTYITKDVSEDISKDVKHNVNKDVNEEVRQDFQ